MAWWQRQINGKIKTTLYMLLVQIYIFKTGKLYRQENKTFVELVTPESESLQLNFKKWKKLSNKRVLWN